MPGPTYYGSLGHLVNWEYIEAVDYPLLQKQWRPGWGDLYCIRRDGCAPHINTVSLWNLHGDGSRATEDHLSSYCWIPRLEQLMHIILGKKMGVVVGGLTDEGLVNAGIVGKAGETEEEALTFELALALALRSYLQKSGKI